MKISEIKERTISLETSLLEAMKRMDEVKMKTLFVLTGEQFEGLITIGDIQRAIISNISLKEPVGRILDRNKIYGFISEGEDRIKDKMRKLRAEVMPILDERGELTDVWFWEDLFKKVELPQRERINLPVVIMAGGKGTRLKPITNVIPKPLVPIGDKTILETILDQFEEIGCTKFYMSVNYKADINQKVEQSAEGNGNRSDIFTQVVNSNLPKSITLNLPIFKGYKPQPVEIEFFAKVDGRDVSFLLISPGANETLEAHRDEAIDAALGEIRDLAPEIAIIEE